MPDKDSQFLGHCILSTRHPPLEIDRAHQLQNCYLFEMPFENATDAVSLQGPAEQKASADRHNAFHQTMAFQTSLSFFASTFCNKTHTPQSRTLMQLLTGKHLPPTQQEHQVCSLLHQSALCTAIVIILDLAQCHISILGGRFDNHGNIGSRTCLNKNTWLSSLASFGHHSVQQGASRPSILVRRSPRCSSCPFPGAPLIEKRVFQSS